MKKTYKAGDKLTDEELASLKDDRCPDCGGKGFLEGPSGGGCQNIKCGTPACGSRFNLEPFGGVKRISDARSSVVQPIPEPTRRF